MICLLVFITQTYLHVKFKYAIFYKKHLLFLEIAQIRAGEGGGFFEYHTIGMLYSGSQFPQFFPGCRAPCAVRSLP